MGDVWVWVVGLVHEVWGFEGVWGSGFWVWGRELGGLALRVSELGSGEWGVGCGVWGVGCGVWGVGCGVSELGCRVWFWGLRFVVFGRGLGV